jgi:hypothetical protein
MLAAILPSGVDRYIALFDGNPIDGGTELTLTGYARVAAQSWTTTIADQNSQRSNTADIVFPNITQAGTATYWAVYDMAVGGTLLRFGTILNVMVPFPIVFTGAGDQPRFLVGMFRIKINEV